MSDSSKPSLSTAQAIALIREGKIETMPSSQRSELRELLKQNPAILVLKGCQDALQRLDGLEPGRVSSESSSAPEPVSPQRSSVSWIAWAFTLTLLAAAGAYLFLPQNSPKSLAFSNSSATEFPSRQEQAPDPKVAESTAPPEPVALAEENTPLPPKPEVPINPLEAEPPKVVEAEPKKAEAALPPAIGPQPEVELVGEHAKLIPDPRGGFRLTGMNGRTKVKLRGKTSRLTVEGVFSNASIDLSALEVHHIEFSKNVTGNSNLSVKASRRGVVEFRGTVSSGSKIKIEAPEGKVEFRGPITGRTRITIDAPGGGVHFHQIARKGANISGNTNLRITAKSVNFAAGLNSRARAEVTLSKGGTLRHGRLNGNSRISYRKANADDPDLTVEGDTSGRGQVVQTGGR